MPTPIRGIPTIPSTVTVHLGMPNSQAENVTVSFLEYIKNVASSELYPTWPESAIRANVYAQVSYALNRIYTEFYRSQGYDFDITNTTAFDQAFVPGRETFETIDNIVDNQFNNYIRRIGNIEPFFAQYCNGSTVTCDGLSQWGTVELANAGYGAYDILTRYYGENIELVQNVPVSDRLPSYPNRVLRLGDAENNVLDKQIQLNRISANYPSIPKINPVDGIFGPETEDAVRRFQQIFELPVTGEIDKATWYRISYLFTSVKRLSELNSEGLSLEDIGNQYPASLRRGDRGNDVKSFQYYLATVAEFYESIRPIAVDGIFGEQTESAVKDAQTTFGIDPSGIADQATWNAIYDAYKGIVDTVDFSDNEPVLLFPGTVLRIGSNGQYVTLLQRYLSTLSQYYPTVPRIPVTGNFGTQTQNAVIAFQRLTGIEPTGVVGPITWNEIASRYSDVTVGQQKLPGQSPGVVLSQEEEGA